MKPGQFITRIILLLLIGLAVSCDERNISIKADQNVVFEVNYSNSAWFKQFKGFLIDRNGLVKTYDNPVSWNPVKENQEVTAGQMQENLLHTSESPFKVPVQQMEQYITKAGHVLSNYSKPARIGADHGIIRYYAYLYNSKKQAYTPVLLAQTGDTEIYNTDENAAEIFEWLAGIYLDVY